MIRYLINYIRKLINRNKGKVKTLVCYNHLTEDEKRWLERRKLIEGIQF